MRFIGVFPGFFVPVGECSTGIDIGWRQEFSLGLGLGEVATFDLQLVYYRRSVGTPLTCGSPAGFANLLPTKAAQAADLATLHPNHANEQTTLTLAQPARPPWPQPAPDRCAGPHGVAGRRATGPDCSSCAADRAARRLLPAPPERSR